MHRDEAAKVQREHQAEDVIKAGDWASRFYRGLVQKRHRVSNFLKRVRKPRK